MFPRLALRAGAAAPLLLRQQANNSGLIVLACRGQKTLVQRVEDWEKAKQIYYGPERDTKNFPIQIQPERAPPVRFGFIPQTWFDFFYEKTGVTGPYMFGVGMLTFVLSKEIWVIEHGFTDVLAFWATFLIIAKKWGHKIGEYLDKQSQGVREVHWEQPLQKAKEQGKQHIANLERSIWQEEGQKHIFEAKRENVDLQLEAEYRQRLAEIHQAVKKRLDYQMDVETVTRTFQQQHMVNWIVNNVVKSITPQQEKDSITKCIQDLKALSLKPT